jgi:uncharacterized protein YkwD
MSNINLVDVLLIIVILFSIWGGYQRGFILGILDLIGWLGSLLLTFLAYPYVVKWLEGYSSSFGMWTVPLAFILAFLVIRLMVGAMINAFLSALPGETHHNVLNRALGIAPGAVNGLIYAAIIAILLFIIPVNNSISAETENSKIASRLTEPVTAIEEKLSPIFDDAVKRSIGRVTVEPESEKFIKLPYKVRNPKPRPDLEAKMLVLVNEERTKRGLKALKADPEMTVVARKHSVDMFGRGYFSHYTPEKKGPFDRMRRDKVRFLTAGENLALARNLNMAHTGLMNSPGHKANILQPAFGRLGIGIMDGGIYGIMVTQNFRN